MPLHQTVQRLLLLGVRLETFPEPPPVELPERLKPVVEAARPEHRRFDERALHFGHRYRSGFWAIYLLSALAVLFAVLPLALGWDSPQHAFHTFAGVWAVCEVLIIAVVSAIYWMGHRRDWQGQWLGARTTAELTWYLPMLAPLMDFNSPAAGEEPNWYVRKFDPGQHLRTADEISTLCGRLEPLVRPLMEGAWSDPVFVQSYVRWTLSILEQQRQYHRRVAARQHALLHRVHSVTSSLFGLTALGALMHLFIHNLWLSVATTSFPALAASLHGALAQSEAYRLGATSERLARELANSIREIEAALHSLGGLLGGQIRGGSDTHALGHLLTTKDEIPLKAAIESALELILEEHQDWHLLVRPHHLPLA